MTREQTLQKLSASGVVAVIRAPSDSQLPDIARALLAGGVLGIEVTMTTPNALRGIAHLRETLGDQIIIGVGTVLDPATAQDAIRAGAEFVVSPVFNPAVVEATRKLEKVSIPGAFTPTEILTAWQAGADVVKVFPATALGPTFFKDLLAPMPFLKLTPTGGVDISTTPAWIKAGAVCVGAGSSLVTKEALTKGDWAGITANARAFIEAVKAGRAK
jgi:2-dehydro-3-deoxyphosphogluconate aldolase / (4S)-4-hydroxy-2-oxoglutarate aldolase